MNLFSDEEFILQEDENTHRTYYTYRKKSPESDKLPNSIVLEEEEKVTIELNKCHYCVYLRLGEHGLTCSNKSCGLFFCSACIRKHPEEVNNKPKPPLISIGLQQNN